MGIAYQFVQTNEDLYGALEKLLKAPLLAVDTETTGLDPHTDRLLLLQLGDGQMNYVIDCTANNALTHKQKDHPTWKMSIDLFKGLATKIFHNASFDLKFIYSHFGVWVKNLFDTMLAERILTAGLNISSSLDSVVPRYTTLTSQDMKKQIRAGFYSGYVLNGFSQDQIEYSARDTDVLIPIYWAQLSRLMDEGLVPTASLEFEVTPVVASMEYTGVTFDINKWAEAIKKIDINRIKKRRKVERVFKENGLEKQQSIFPEFCTISVDSPAQLLSALKRLGIPTESTDSNELSRLSGEYPFITTLLEYKGLQKLSKAYGESLLQKINPSTGRLHPHFNQLVATGRFSSYDPNIQQIPKDSKSSLRECFIAPNGFVCLTADYSQQELRCIAAVSGEKNMLESYYRDEDLHTFTASFLFNRDLEELKSLLASLDRKLENDNYSDITKEEKEAKEQRSIAKNVNFLISYGGSYKKLAYTACVAEDYAKNVMDTHSESFPSLKNWIRKEGEKTLRNMYSKTLLGRKRYYTLPDQNDPDYEKIKAAIKRQGVNHVIQGTCASITKKALVYTHNEFENKFGFKAYIWGAIHDEIACMVHEDIADEARRVLISCMERAFYDFIPKELCPIKVDSKLSKYWSH